MAEVSIRGLNKAAVLAALFNNAVSSRQSSIAPQDRQNLTKRQARALWRSGEIVARSRLPWRHHVRFDYLLGRPLKLIFRGEVLEATVYDINHGQGKAAVIGHLRRTGSTRFVPG